MLVSWWRKLAQKRMTRAALRGRRSTLRVETLEERATPALIFATGSAPGLPPVVTVFDATTRQQKFTITAFDAAFTGGTRVAVGDVNGDGTPDVVAGAGAGGGPQVIVFDGKTGLELFNRFVFEDTFRGGVAVSAGDLNGDGKADVVAAAGFDGGPRVSAFAGDTGAPFQ